MNLPEQSAKRRTVRFMKAIVLGILIVLARATFASCGSEAESGWRIGQICASWFDTNGNYVDSRCQLDEYENPFGNYHMECKPGIAPGTCSGSNCDGLTPSCTHHGFCLADADCCGNNSCDQDSMRCYDPEAGGHVGLR